MKSSRKIKAHQKKFNISTLIRDFSSFVVDPASFIDGFYQSVKLDFWSTFRDDFENGVNYSNWGLDWGLFMFPDSIPNRFQKKAKQSLEKFIANNSNDERVAEAHYQLGRLLYERGKEREVLEHCKKAIEFDRTHREAHNLFEQCGEEIGYDLEGYFQEAVTSNPDYKRGYSYLGLRHLEKDPEKAIEYYKKAPDDFHTHFFLSTLYGKKGLDKEEFNELAQISDPDHHIKTFLGFIVNRHLDDMSFVDICEHAITLNPKKVSPYKYLAKGYCEKEMFDEALQTYQRVLEFEPDNPEIFWAMAYTYHKAGNLEKAVEVCSKLLDIKAYRDSGLYALGGMYYDSGDYGRALDTWKKLNRRSEFCTEGSGDIWWGEAITRKDLIKDAKEKLNKG